MVLCWHCKDIEKKNEIKFLYRFFYKFNALNSFDAFAIHARSMLFSTYMYYEKKKRFYALFGCFDREFHSVANILYSRSFQVFKQVFHFKCCLVSYEHYFMEFLLLLLFIMIIFLENIDRNWLWHLNIVIENKIIDDLDGIENWKCRQYHYYGNFAQSVYCCDWFATLNIVFIANFEWRIVLFSSFPLSGTRNRFIKQWFHQFEWQITRITAHFTLRYSDIRLQSLIMLLHYHCVNETE